MNHRKILLKIIDLALPITDVIDTVSSLTNNNSLFLFYGHFHEELPVPLEQIEENLLYLKKKFTLLDTPTAFLKLENHTLPKRSATIIFDDAMESFKNIGYPILKRNQIPFTLAVIPGLIKTDEIYHLKARIMRAAGHKYYLDHKEMLKLADNFLGKEYNVNNFSDLFDSLGDLNKNDLEALAQQLKAPDQEFMSWNSLRNILSDGLASIFNHSMSHPHFRFASGEWLIWELDFSKRLLEKNLGIEISSFVYPYGSANDILLKVEEKIVKFGYKYALTTCSGIMKYSTNKLRIPRNELEIDNTLFRLFSKQITNFLTKRI